MRIDSARHQRVSDIFLAAVRADPGFRATLLDSHCGDDAELRGEVESLLSHHDSVSVLIAPALGHEFRLERLHDLPNARGGVTAPPRLIGRYRIRSVLGEGGMGVVYLAEQENPRRIVALKIIKPGVMSTRALKRFQHEAQMLGRLQHPGIAQILEAGTAAIAEHDDARSQPYFAMEYVRGQPLLAFATSHQLATRQRLELFVQICEAVQHAHQHGVVHRDLKPANILVVDDGPLADDSSLGPQSSIVTRCRPKILDFGVARCTDSDVQATTLQTDAGQLIGTISYMSPEQASGDPQKVDARSDVYALAVICYELLTGRLPHDLCGKSIPQALRIIGQEEPTPLSSTSRVFRGDLNTIITKGLEKEPSRRYASVAELAGDMQRYLDRQPIVARPASMLYQLGKFAQRNKALVGGVAAVFVALLAGLTVSSWLLVRARDAEGLALRQKAEAEQETRKSRAFGNFLYEILTTGDPAGVEGRDISVMVQRLDAAAVEVRSMLADLPDVRAALQQTIGEAYQALGLYERARALFEESLSARRRLFGDDHLEVATGILALAWLRHDRSDYSAAERLYRQALAIRVKHLGRDHPEVWQIMNQLALCLHEDHDPAQLVEAGALCREVLAGRRRVFPQRSDEIASTLGAYGSILRDEGDLQGSEAALREALETCRIIYGLEDTRCASMQLNLGYTLRRQGRLDEAEQAVREGLAMRRRVLGDHHVALTHGSLQLARILIVRKQFAEAEALCRDAMAIRADRLGPEHRQVGDAMEVLTEVVAAAGRVDEARELGMQTLIGHQRDRGEDHRDTLAWADKLRSLGLVEATASDHQQPAAGMFTGRPEVSVDP